jgi:hypothetical protein
MEQLLKIIVLGFLALVVLSVLGVFAFVSVVTPTRVTVVSAPPPANAATHDGLWAQASNLHQDSGGAHSGPPAGQKYIVVHIVLTNQGTHAVSYSALNFQLEHAADHVRHDADAFDTNISPTALTSGSIEANERIAGDIAFQVPARENGFRLLWTPDILNDSIPVPLT